MPDDSTTRSAALLCAHREIEQKIYRKGKQGIRDQYTTTNITYPGHGRATREMYTQVRLATVQLARAGAADGRIREGGFAAERRPESGGFAVRAAGDRWARFER